MKRANFDSFLTTFTNAAASELQSRVKKILNINVKAKTLHSLGLEIIANAEKRKPTKNNGMHKTLGNAQNRCRKTPSQSPTTTTATTTETRARTQ